MNQRNNDKFILPHNQTQIYFFFFRFGVKNKKQEPSSSCFLQNVLFMSAQVKQNQITAKFLIGPSVTKNWDFTYFLYRIYTGRPTFLCKLFCCYFINQINADTSLISK